MLWFAGYRTRSTPASPYHIHAPQAALTKAVRDLLVQYLGGVQAVPIRSGFAAYAIPDWALGDSGKDPSNLF